MLRKTITILSLIGLLLSVGLWGVSYWYVIVSYAPARCSIFLTNGHLAFTYQTRSPTFDAKQVAQGLENYFESEGLDTVSLGGAVIGWMGTETMTTTWWRFTFEHTNGDTEVGLPLWVPCLVFSVLPAYAVALFHRRRKRRWLGLCVKCGYSLRTLTRPRCPECDTPFSEKLLAAFRPIKNGVNHRGLRGQYARITAALFPELRRFETEFDRRVAWKSANRKVLWQPLYWLCIAALIPAMAGGAWFMSIFALLIFSLVILLVWTYVTFVLVARRTIQHTLRQRLIERGVPICLKCGYDIRESQDRCPECGGGISK